MKKSITPASPFLMLLIPVFLCIGLLLATNDLEIPAGKMVISDTFQLPALKVLVKALF